MRQLRVLIVVQNLPVPLDRRVWLECQALVRAGYGVSVICPKGPDDLDFEVLSGVRIHRYAPPPEAKGALGYAYEFVYCWLRTAWLAARVLRIEGFDAIQACNPPDTFWLLGRVLKVFGKRFVFDHHDLCPELYTSRFGRSSGFLLRGLRTLEWATLRTADHVISPNESYRRVALTRGGRSAAEVTVVRSGPDLTRLKRRAATPAFRNGRRHLCVYLGVMNPQDGVHLLIEAADVIVNEMARDDVQFALLGFGDCVQSLRAQVRELGLDDYVTFAGRADDEMICAYLSSADVGLAPDPSGPLNDLSTMNKVVEYMAFGVAVVSFDLHESRESAGGAAAFVQENDPREFAKAVCELLDDDERRRRMGALGRQRVETSLAWHHQAAAYVGVYRTLFAEQRNRRTT